MSSSLQIEDSQPQAAGELQFKIQDVRIPPAKGTRPDGWPLKVQSAGRRIQYYSINVMNNNKNYVNVSFKG